MGELLMYPWGNPSAHRYHVGDHESKSQNWSTDQSHVRVIAVTGTAEEATDGKIKSQISRVLNKR